MDLIIRNHDPVKMKTGLYRFHVNGLIHIRKRAVGNADIMTAAPNPDAGGIKMLL